jgi:hypothetical protein
MGKGRNRNISILGQPNASVFIGCNLVLKKIRLHLPISSIAEAPGTARSILIDNTLYPTIRVTVKEIKKATRLHLIYSCGWG